MESGSFEYQDNAPRQWPKGSPQLPMSRGAPGHGPTFSKIFRWQPPDAQAPPPVSVELAGSFTEWRPVAFSRDAITNTWQLSLKAIPGNRSHRYMLLVNGEPAHDKNSDGLAVPQGFDEQRYQLTTARGPRVFLCFAQTK
jgi:hypothetical protein